VPEHVTELRFDLDEMIATPTHGAGAFASTGLRLLRPAGNWRRTCAEKVGSVGTLAGGCSAAQRRGSTYRASCEFSLSVSLSVSLSRFLSLAVSVSGCLAQCTQQRCVVYAPFLLCSLPLVRANARARRLERPLRVSRGAEAFSDRGIQ
jgi:hypothetical protein